MADYGGIGGGRSLRDALNAIMPMTGMGEYGAMFPPQTGSPQPGPPVPLPPPRPPQAGPGAQYLPLPNPAGAPAPGLALPQGIQPNVPMPIGAPPGGPPGAPGGGAALPIGPNLNAFAGASRPGPGNYVARLGLAGALPY